MSLTGTVSNDFSHQANMTLITEIGDFNLVPHPKKMLSWHGMDIWEYSSGGGVIIIE